MMYTFKAPFFPEWHQIESHGSIASADQFLLVLHIYLHVCRYVANLRLPFVMPSVTMKKEFLMVCEEERQDCVDKKSRVHQSRMYIPEIG